MFTTSMANKYTYPYPPHNPLPINHIPIHAPQVYPITTAHHHSSIDHTPLTTTLPVTHTPTVHYIPLTTPPQGAVVSPSDEDSHQFTVNASNGEVYRLKAQHTKERQFWVDRIRSCIQSVPLVGVESVSMPSLNNALVPPPGQRCFAAKHYALASLSSK